MIGTILDINDRVATKINEVFLFFAFVKFILLEKTAPILIIKKKKSQFKLKVLFLQLIGHK